MFQSESNSRSRRGMLEINGRSKAETMEETVCRSLETRKSRLSCPIDSGKGGASKRSRECVEMSQTLDVSNGQDEW